MYFFIFIGGVNTRTSMIKTNVFFDVIDFQVPPLPNLTKVPAVMPSDPAQMAALFERVVSNQYFQSIFSINIFNQYFQSIFSINIFKSPCSRIAQSNILIHLDCSLFSLSPTGPDASGRCFDVACFAAPERWYVKSLWYMLVVLVMHLPAPTTL
jgi:hypothetical protein